MYAGSLETQFNPLGWTERDLGSVDGMELIPIYVPGSSDPFQTLNINDLVTSQIVVGNGLSSTSGEINLGGPTDSNISIYDVETSSFSLTMNGSIAMQATSSGTMSLGNFGSGDFTIQKSNTGDLDILNNGSGQFLIRNSSGSDLTVQNNSGALNITNNTGEFNITNNSSSPFSITASGVESTYFSITGNGVSSFQLFEEGGENQTIMITSSGSNTSSITTNTDGRIAFRSLGSSYDYSVFIDSLGFRFLADQSENYLDRSITDKNYQDTHLAGQDMSSVLQSPTSSEHGYSLTWDDSVNAFTLTFISTSILGTPVNNQLAVWTDSSTIEGNEGLIYDSSDDRLLVGSEGFGLVGTNSTNQALIVSGASTQSVDDGARIVLYGNDQVNNGLVTISAGDVLGGSIQFYTENDLKVILEHDGGLVVGNAIGGSQGDGSINARTVYDDGAILTDYVFEKYYLGKTIDESHADYSMMSFKDAITFVEGNYHLPTMIGREEWEVKRAGLGAIASQLWESVETHFLYLSETKSDLDILKEKVSQLQNRIKELETKDKITLN